jgi:hypothetical protein
MTYSEFKQQFLSIWQLGTMREIRHWQAQYPEHYEAWLKECEETA